MTGYRSIHIEPGIYSIAEPHVRALNIFPLPSNSSHVFIDRIKGENLRILPCSCVTQVPSQIQRIEFFYSETLGWSLVINGELQLGSSDELQYHQALVSPTIEAKLAIGRCASVAIIGGGDGCALRESLALLGSNCNRCLLVDYDPCLVSAFRSGQFAEIFQTKDALSDNRVEIVFEDYRSFLRRDSLHGFDIAIIDLTDAWCVTDDSVTETFRLLTSSDTVRYIGAQLGPSRPEVLIGLHHKLPSIGVCPLAFWEIHLASFGEPWCFGLFGLGGTVSVPEEWGSSFSYGQLKLLEPPWRMGKS